MKQLSFKISALTFSISFPIAICFAQTSTSTSPLLINPNLLTISPTSSTSTTTTAPSSTTTTDPNAATTSTGNTSPTTTGTAVGTLSPTNQNTSTSTQPAATTNGTQSTTTQPAPPRTSQTIPGIVSLPQTQPQVPATCPATNNTAPSTVPECPTPPAPLPPQPIVPALPTALIVTPILGVLLFWLILSALNRTHLKSEARLQNIHLKNAHSLSVSTSREKSYRQMLDFLTLELTSSQPFNQKAFQHLSAQIELLGSNAIKELNKSLSTAFQKQNRPEIKKLLGDFAAQIRKES